MKGYIGTSADCVIPDDLGMRRALDPQEIRLVYSMISARGCGKREKTLDKRSIMM
jgi:hypothetical protein